ncbi:carbonic anhydrase [Aulographum hederae CBS 113979]|uniref:Carbonic anhydrase n=1 Tax=Aulographum hederae CBS 113979 TaxID=1176131 RepID=A0A6G1HEY8_9PEZI|nr:carbonic anhydrase [Aulographum hederae CBS 113979]
MLFRALLPFASFVSLGLACADHDNFRRESSLHKRAEGGNWTYEASYDWHKIDHDYELCQTGTTQSPIPLLVSQGLSLAHEPSFSFAPSSNGTFHNWGYGPAFTLDVANGSNLTANPKATFEDHHTGEEETVYLKGWHIHSPADHTVQGDRSKAEMHFVFGDAEGHERAVFAMRIDPGNHVSRFFSQLPPMISFRDKELELINVPLDLAGALEEVNFFREFWTYRGSLTSPPCTEGIRWYVARNILFVSNEQMQNFLRVSTYSARAEQEVWNHAINV